MPIYWLSQETLDFPPPTLANPEGILAVGGDLSPARLLLAYQQGIFPWFNPDDPILWWSPDPRFVLFPNELKVAHSMRPYFNQEKFQLTFDQAFPEVMQGCGFVPRKGQSGATWISKAMIEAYTTLHEMGHAHSVEVWEGGKLVGGLYGIALGRVFYGESMFATVSNASKFGFISLVRQLAKRDFWMVDCQQKTRHLASMGARSIPRRDFLEILAKNNQEPVLKETWQNWLDS